MTVMNSMSLVKTEYSGHCISFNEGAWFNATEAASFYGKRPIDWLRLKETKEYADLLCQFHKVSQNHFVKTRRGTKSPGTWFHPRLAVPFARWCDARFAVWCDDQISKILQGTHPYYDWKRSRHAVTASEKVMKEALRIVRENGGKATESFHYINEVRLINWVLKGKFASLDRDILSEADLDLLVALETRNTILISQGFIYQERKSVLKSFVVNHRAEPVAEIWPEPAEEEGKKKSPVP